MILIGERINGMFKDVKAAIQQRDKTTIVDWAVRQTQSGADYLDVNVGTAAEDPIGAMKWLVGIVQEAVATPLCLDSQKLPVIEAGLSVVDSDRKVMLNSTPYNKKDDDEIMLKYLDAAMPHEASVICLTMDARGIPQDVDTRVEIAAMATAAALEADFSPERLYIDPIVMPVSAGEAQAQGGRILEVLPQIKMINDPPVMTTCGLSNISSNAKQRPLINQAFLLMAMAAGLDSAILNVCDDALVDSVAAAEIVLNQRIYSDSFLQAFRHTRAQEIRTRVENRGLPSA